MSKSVGYALTLYFFWLIGALFFTNGLDRDARGLYMSLPLTGPLLAIALLGIVVWITNKLHI